MRGFLLGFFKTEHIYYYFSYSSGSYDLDSLILILFIYFAI